MVECRREARVRTGLTTLFSPKRVDLDLFNRCMERRGYTVRRSD